MTRNTLVEKFYPRTPKPKSFPHFAKLSDDTICRILYSGYLGLTLEELSYIISVSKRLQALGYVTIGILRTNRLGAVETFLPKLPNLLHLNLQFSSFPFTPKLLQSILWRKSSLRSLNLRSTGVDDYCLGEIAKLVNLEFLVVSKSSSDFSGQITDIGGCQLAALRQLIWLDLSMTCIGDLTLNAIGSSLRYLEHLRLQCCPNVTDQGVASLRALPLRVLDIRKSTASSLSAEVILLLSTPESLLYDNLEILDISFIPDLTVMHMRRLAAMPALTHVACRSRFDEDRAEIESIRRELIEKFRSLVILHHDQLKLPAGVDSVADYDPYKLSNGILFA